MKTSVPLRTKVRDIAIGFFGWLILGNLVYLLLFLGLGFLANIDLDYLLPLISSIIWLSTIIASIILYFKKRIWIFAGVLAVFAINGISWIVILSSEQIAQKLGLVLMFLGFPLPLGYFPLAIGY
jgi:hypothetical protein